MLGWLGAFRAGAEGAFGRRAMLLGLAAAAALWVTIPPDSVAINLRWRDGITAEARESLERRFALVDGEPLGENTWRYRLRGYSREQIRALVIDEAVAD